MRTLIKILEEIFYYNTVWRNNKGFKGDLYDSKKILLNSRKTLQEFIALKAKKFSDHEK